ncbi:helicase RepA family protein [Parafrankia sp. BMG5.11]|uniref:AAA family ATPase n=1 Tax=Parafrankia sp. BMG5.11 TaxID=222540 RepID=UPI001039D795|nr:helicase RepA family protein [Parafrankia sp. BMG5.11]TCJ38384.1 AAA family ATPase [Parafrankia sp. BMG5.11]
MSVHGSICQQRSFPSLRCYAEGTCAMSSEQALAFGLCGHERADVVSKKYLAESSNSKPVVARTRDCFSYAKAPGIMMLDYDLEDGDAVLGEDELVEVLRAAVPELPFVPIALKPSSSSCLVAPDGRQLTDLGRSHAFLPVRDAQRIPEFAKIIDQRLWLAGWGNIRIRADGKCDPVTLFDQAVFKPEHLCFVRACCQDGVRQEFPGFTYFPGAADEMLERETWLEDLKPLSGEECAEVDQLIAEARALTAPEAQRRRAEWAEVHVRRCEARAPIAPDERDALLQSFVQTEEQVLPAELILYPEEGGSVTVREVLADRATWHSKRFADPFDPDYRGDRRIATAYLDHGEPCIRSHAHGGQTYQFRSEQARMEESIRDFADLTVRRRFEAVPAGQWIAGKRTEWLVKGVLPLATVGLVYGPPACGKTFWVLDLAASVALGVPWNTIECGQGSVVYICAEGASGFRNRIHAYMEYHGADFGEHLRVIGDQPDLLTREDPENLIRELDLVSPTLVIIDTLAQVIPGGDENSAEAMGEALKVCRDIHARTGAMVLLVHHTGKDSEKGPRGWSGLRGAVDVELSVARFLGGNRAQITKMKDGAEGSVYPFKLHTVRLSKVDAEETASSCIVVHGGADAREVSQAQPTGKVQKRVMSTVIDLSGMADGVPIESLLDRVVEETIYFAGPDPERPKRDQRRSHAERALKQLIEDGFLFRHGDIIFAHDPDDPNVSNVLFEAVEATVPSPA